MSAKIDHWWLVSSGLRVGFITPPLGLNLFVVSGMTGEPILKVAAKKVPYVFAMAMVVFMFAFIPQLSPWAIQ